MSGELIAEEKQLEKGIVKHQPEKRQAEDMGKNRDKDTETIHENRAVEKTADYNIQKGESDNVYRKSNGSF